MIQTVLAPGVAWPTREAVAHAATYKPRRKALRNGEQRAPRAVKTDPVRQKYDLNATWTKAVLAYIRTRGGCTAADIATHAEIELRHVNRALRALRAFERITAVKTGRKYGNGCDIYRYYIGDGRD